ncbi:MAG: hypothetical protein ACLSCA_03105 [[Clostridium] symbiosum]
MGLIKMMILSQNGEVMVNVENLHSITTYKLGDYQRGEKMEKKHRILAWYGNGEDDCWGIGDYETEDRAKEIIRAIWQKYGEYLHRQGGPAVLRGSVEVPEMIWVLPKLYEMPQE